MINYIKGWRIWLKQLLMLMMGLFCFAALSVCQAYSGEVVRVGIFNLGNFQYFDADGSVRGYNIDFLDKISETTHWDYEYVPCQNWVEATKLLDEGKIDLLAPTQKLPMLQERYLYPAYQMGTEFAAIYTLQERDDLVYEDFTAMKELNFGGAKNSSFTRNFISFAKEYGFEPHITYYNNTTELFAALNNKEVDAIVTNIMFATDNIKTLGRFTPMPVYYIANKNNQSIIRELENAMATIELNNPTFAAELVGKHFPQYRNTQFSYAEYQFIKQMPEITIGYFPERRPISYTEKGEFQGIARDILDDIAKISGLKFRYVELPSSKPTYEEMQGMGVDMIAGIRYNALSSMRKNMRLSHPYFLSESVFVAKEKTYFNANDAIKIAIVDESGTFPAMIQNRYPNFMVDIYPTLTESLAAVKNDDAEMALANRYIVEANIANPRYGSMQVLPIESITDEFCLAVLMYDDGNISDKSQMLAEDIFLTIINKSIDQLDSGVVNMIVATRVAENMYNYTIDDFGYQYRYFIVLLLVLIGTCFWMLARSRSLKEMKNMQLKIKNEQLMEAVQQADQANKAKSVFLSRMSHEIRTPMNAIVGITTIAKSYLHQPDKINEYLDKIKSSSKILLNIINDVLDMSAIENEKLKIAHSRFDFKELLSTLSAMYYGQCKSKGVHFEMNSSNVRDEILIGDTLRVNQIMLNLISNAYKFTPAGGKITVTVEESSRNGNQVFMRISVADTGVGMSEDMQKRLFKSFEQEDAVTAQKYGGSGLGMAITGNLVELMHGAISVESHKGKGSTFSVELPFEVAVDSQPVLKGDLGDIRALIVDDDEGTLEYTSIIMDRIGVAYDVANSGEAAVAMLEEAYENGRSYKLCFIDWKMSGLDGIAVTEQIRSKFDKSAIIIIVSAYDVSEAEDAARQAGADMMLPKPLFQSTVFNLLMNMNGGRYVRNTAKEGSFDFGGIKVLLAEDNELNREIAVELLNMVNIETECAEDGRIAVQKFVDSAPDEYKLILMDVQMPHLDGYAATRQIRTSNHPQARNIPIIAMTANAFNEDIAAALAAGMNDHVAKPIDNEILYKTIAKFLQ